MKLLVTGSCHSVDSNNHSFCRHLGRFQCCEWVKKQQLSADP